MDKTIKNIEKAMSSQKCKSNISIFLIYTETNIKNERCNTKK